jgi:Mn-dependent DtxR family transcriptional regulator
MTRDDAIETIVEWVSDTFGGLEVHSSDVDELIGRLENLGLVIVQP